MKQLVYVVEDEQSIRELYTYIIENAGYAVRCFENASELFEATADAVPDLFILDIMLDGMDGYEILRKIKAENALCGVPVIMVSAKGDEINKVKGLDLGADDYIAKPFGVLELVARINANLRKTARVEKKTEYKDVVIDDDAHKVYVCGKSCECTLKEYKLLKLLLENSEKVVERDEILNKVWDIDFSCETRTLDMHIKRLRSLLSEKESVTEIVTVRGVGYVLK